MCLFLFYKSKSETVDEHCCGKEYETNNINDESDNGGEDNSGSSGDSDFGANNLYDEVDGTNMNKLIKFIMFKMF